MQITQPTHIGRAGWVEDTALADWQAMPLTDDPCQKAADLRAKNNRTPNQDSLLRKYEKECALLTRFLDREFFENKPVEPEPNTNPKPEPATPDRQRKTPDLDQVRPDPVRPERQKAEPKMGPKTTPDPKEFIHELDLYRQ